MFQNEVSEKARCYIYFKIFELILFLIQILKYRIFLLFSLTQKTFLKSILYHFLFAVHKIISKLQHQYYCEKLKY